MSSSPAHKFLPVISLMIPNNEFSDTVPIEKTVSSNNNKF